MQTTTGSPLVAGATGSNPTDTQVHIRAIRSFMHAGAPVPVGTVLEVSRLLAHELIANGKAVGDDTDRTRPEPAVDEIEINAERAADPVRSRRGRPPKPKE